MKKTNLKNKLQLRRESVRPLTTGELRNVVGGMGRPMPPPTSNNLFGCQTFTFNTDHCGTLKA